jgi:hypothetical protein
MRMCVGRKKARVTGQILLRYEMRLVQLAGTFISIIFLYSISRDRFWRKIIIIHLALPCKRVREQYI